MYSPLVLIQCSSSIEPFFNTVLQVLLTRLQNSKTEAFTIKFVRFYHFVVAEDDKGYGADFFLNLTEQVQAG